MRKVLSLTSLLLCLTVVSWAQTRKLTGLVVTSENGANLSGASVTIKGTTKGVVTNADGKFSIDIPTKGNPVVVINSVGYVAQEIRITTQTELFVKLSADTKALEDVVVVGYGSVKKKDLTGAVGSISSPDIVRANPANATQALQGQLPGVVVTKRSSKPGQDFSIDIRGQSTITGVTEPLVVIDGVIGARIRDINPADIQSIDVLKDASSTAIYGARGANGVIIITSKKGISGRPRVTVDSYLGTRVPDHLPELQNAAQFYKHIVTDWALNAGGGSGNLSSFTASELNQVNTGKSINWVDELTQNGMTANTTVAVSGGSNGTIYRFSGGYINESGNIPYTSFKKFNLNSAIETKLNNFLKVGFTAYINYHTNPTGSFEALRSAYRARPTGVKYYKEVVNPSEAYDLNQGPWYDYSVWMGVKDNQLINPIIEADKNNYQFTGTTSNAMGNAFAEINLLKGLTFRSSISASVIGFRQGEYRGTFTKDRVATQLARGSYSTQDIGTYTLDNQLSYNLSKGKSKLNVTALQSAFKNTTENYGISYQALPFASYWFNLGTAGGPNTISSSYARNSLLSYMARVNYTFNDKYLLTLTGRADGASQLSVNNKWAFFPSGAFAWKLGEEDFIKDANIFSDLKLRVSYGEVGNSNVSAYSTLQGLVNTVYGFGQSVGNGFAPGSTSGALGNKNLKWEKSQELNLGLNMGFADNRITAAVEVYKRNTKDLILAQSLPTSSGYTNIITNVGKVSNKGVEILLTTRNIVSKNFSWTTNVNFSKNINRIEALANGVKSIIGSSLFVGYPVRSLYDYQAIGIWQIPDTAYAKVYSQVPGSVRVKDQNGDGKISNSPGIDDRVVLGTQLPNYVMGMTNKFTMGDFDFSFLLYYRNGTLYKNGLLDGTMGDIGNSRYNHIVLNYWTRENPTNDYYGPGIASNPYRGARSYEDASFLRISDVTMGYTVPQSFLNKKGVDRMRLYFQVINPRYFTKYNGQDPEYNSNSYQDDVPNTIYAFGANIGF